MLPLHQSPNWLQIKFYHIYKYYSIKIYIFINVWYNTVLQVIIMNKLIRYIKHLTFVNYRIQLEEVFSDIEEIFDVYKVKGNKNHLFVSTDKGYFIINIKNDSIVIRHNESSYNVSESIINRVTKKLLTTYITKYDGGLKISTIEKFYDCPKRNIVTDIEEKSFIVSNYTFNKIYPNESLELIDMSKYFQQIKYINEDLYSLDIPVDLEYTYSIHYKSFIDDDNNYPYVLFNNRDISDLFTFICGEDKVMRTYNFINGNVEELVSDSIINITKLSSFNYLNKTKEKKLENNILK